MTNNAELKPLNQDMDARRWADEFNEVLVSKGEQPHDPGWLIAWFANAIMAGADVTRWKFEKREAELLHVVREMARALNKAELAFRENLDTEEQDKMWIEMQKALSLAREVLKT